VTKSPAIPHGTDYAAMLRHLSSQEGAMKAKKSRGKGKPAGRRGVKDLPVSGAKVKSAKGGVLSSAVSEVMKNFGSALNTAARGG
jgi:hypothetical protein